jgi:CspA family cold shock protein
MKAREFGYVKNFFGPPKGFGFIRRENGEDLFVHISQCAFLPLQAGQHVSFDVDLNPRNQKLEAKAVAILTD